MTTAWKTWTSENPASADVNGNFDRVPPIGAIIAWTKTFDQEDSGTTTSTTADHLVETGQNFNTTISVGDLVHNTTDSTFAYVTAVNSDTDLTIDTDIMASGETYAIYSTPALEDCWVECNGQALSDADSKYNGATIPNLNASGGGSQRFLRGSTTSGTTGGSETHTHSMTGSGGFQSNIYGMTTANHLPPYYEIVWIMRVK